MNFENKERVRNMKEVYWIVSGEGENGTWKRVETTPLGIKQRLTRERCGGNRWARAYGDIYITAYGCAAGFDVEGNHPPSMLPDEAKVDAQ